MYGQIHTKLNKYVNYKIKKLVFPFKILTLIIIPIKKRFESCTCFHCFVVLNNIHQSIFRNPTMSVHLLHQILYSISMSFLELQ